MNSWKNILNKLDSISQKKLLLAYKTTRAFIKDAIVGCTNDELTEVVFHEYLNGAINEIATQHDLTSNFVPQIMYKYWLWVMEGDEQRAKQMMSKATSMIDLAPSGRWTPFTQARQDFRRWNESAETICRGMLKQYLLRSNISINPEFICDECGMEISFTEYEELISFDCPECGGHLEENVQKIWCFYNDSGKLIGPLYIKDMGWCLRKHTLG